MRIFRALFLISIVLLFGTVAYQKSGLRGNGISVDGEPVSESEAQQSVREMSDVAKGFDPSQSPSSGGEAKTKLGRLMQEMIEGVRSIETWHAAETKDLTLASIVANSSLRSDSAIRGALKRLAKLESIETEYFRRREDIVNAYGERLGNPASFEKEASESRSLLEGLLTAEKNVFASVRDYLNFARRHKHRVDAEKKLVYWGSDDLEQTRHLLTTIDEKLAEDTKLQAEADSRMKDVQQKLGDLANSAK